MLSKVNSLYLFLQKRGDGFFRIREIISAPVPAEAVVLRIKCCAEYLFQNINISEIDIFITDQNFVLIFFNIKINENAISGTVIDCNKCIFS